MTGSVDWKGAVSRLIGRSICQEFYLGKFVYIDVMTYDFGFQMYIIWHDKLIESRDKLIL